MTDATELDEAAVRAAVEQADGTQWTEEWWRCHASSYFQAAMGGAPDLVSYFNTVTPTTMRQLLAALDEARSQVKHWKDHAEEAGEGFTQVCLDYARVSAQASHHATRASAAEAQVERLHFDLDREAHARQAAESALEAVGSDLKTLAFDMHRGWKHVRDGADAAVLIDRFLDSHAALATPTTPDTTTEGDRA